MRIFGKKWVKAVNLAVALLFGAQTGFAGTTNDFLRVKPGVESPVAGNMAKDLGVKKVEEAKTEGVKLASTPDIATLDDVNVEGKTVLVRIDINVDAENGSIKNIDKPHSRVIEAAKTLKELSDKGAKVVAIFHQGRPGEATFMDNPTQHAEQLSKLIGKDVRPVNDLLGDKALTAISGLNNGDIILLKPARAKDPATGKTLEENPYFADIIKSHIDILIIDGFSVAHRDSASVTGIKGVPMVAGRLMEREINNAYKVLNPETPHLVVVGGGKIKEKLEEVEYSIKVGRADKILLGGMLSYLALVAVQPEAESAKSEEEMYNLAVKTLGKGTANDLRKELKDFLPRMVQALKGHRNIIELPTDMVAVSENSQVENVKLTEGYRVPEGYDKVISGIGEDTAKNYAKIINETPFKSAFVVGPLVNYAKYKQLDQYAKPVIEAIGNNANIKFWATGGGDTEELVQDLVKNYNINKPSYSFLAGGALVEFRAGKTLPGVTALIKYNATKALPSYMPATDEQEHVVAHSDVFNPIVKAIKNAGGSPIIRTAVFGRGAKVGAVAIRNTQLADAVKSNMKIWGKGLSFETMTVDTQNPWIDYSMSTIRAMKQIDADTRGKSEISAEAVREILRTDKDVALIEIPGGVDKKGKPQPPGQIDTKKFEEDINNLLLKELRKRGIDTNSVAKNSARLPTIAQVTDSSIKGELKIAIFMPSTKHDIGRLMQLAQDSGINLKGLLESYMPAPAPKGQVALLGEPKSAISTENTTAQPAAPKASSSLAGLTLGGVAIDENLQTIFIDKYFLASFIHTPPLSVTESELENIINRVGKEAKIVRIVVPANSGTEKQLKSMLDPSNTNIGDLIKLNSVAIGSHPISRNGDVYASYIIQPKVQAVIVGYGNEAIKLAPMLEEDGFGKPDVSIFSLARPERVVHAFLMGYGVYLTDQSDKNNVDLYRDASGNPTQAYNEFVKQLKKVLEDAFIAKYRNQLLAGIPESERIAKYNTVQADADAKGKQEAAARLKNQFKGLLSDGFRLAQGRLLVMDASPEGSGLKNKNGIYKILDSNPDAKIIYQGGEKNTTIDSKTGKIKEGVASVSFSAITADFENIAASDIKHIRQVSCNTTGLSSMVVPIVEALRASENTDVILEVDNLAVRRVVDPGDLKGAVVTVSYNSAYHHGPDLVTVLPEDDVALIPVSNINTDAAQSGSTTRFHMHMLSIRRADGKVLDPIKVKQILAAQSRVALVDFPDGEFDSTRFSELTHNLLTQWGNWAPDGANHPLVPIVTVQATDDPSEVRLLYAVPQESIVAASNINAAHAIFDLASKDASLAIVNDAVGIPQLVQAIETRMPVKNGYIKSIAGNSGEAEAAQVTGTTANPADIAKSVMALNDPAQIEPLVIGLDANARQKVKEYIQNTITSINKTMADGNVPYKANETLNADIAHLQEIVDFIDRLPVNIKAVVGQQMDAIDIASEALKINDGDKLKTFLSGFDANELNGAREQLRNIAGDMNDSILDPEVAYKGHETLDAHITKIGSVIESIDDILKEGRATDLVAGEAKDSRGKPTVSVTLNVGEYETTGDVPAGASKGEDEAQTAPATETVSSTEQAIKNVNEVILPMLKNANLDLSKHEDLLKAERLIIAAAGDNFKTLGANATVPVSWALWKMAAKLNNMDLWEYIRMNEPDAIDNSNKNPVYFYMNIYNGGLHALKTDEKLGEDRIDIQEIMIAPIGAKTHAQALKMGDDIDRALKGILSEKEQGKKLTRADEAGFSVKGLGESDRAIGYVFEAIEKAGYKPGADVKLALDVAASSFFKSEKGKYEFQGKDLTSEDMVKYYSDLVDKYDGKIISIEDGLAENDWSGWQKLTEAMKSRGIKTIGDDLFVTQLPRLNKGIAEKSATSILIKVNQNGTISGTLDVIKQAIKNNMDFVVSHRSGETMSNGIADFAYATKARGLKTGAPQPEYDYGKGGEYENSPLVRRAKYARMVEIENKISASVNAPVSNDKGELSSELRSLVNDATKALTNIADRSKLSSDDEAVLAKIGIGKQEKGGYGIVFSAGALFDAGLGPIVADIATRNSGNMKIVAILHENDAAQKKVIDEINSKIPLDMDKVLVRLNVKAAAQELKGYVNIQKVKFVGTQEDISQLPKGLFSEENIVIAQKILSALSKIGNLGDILKNFTTEYNKYKELNIQA